MPELPLFSMITASLNALKDLQDTAISLRNQACQDFEWIVIDGGSADDTPAWLAQSRARWISEKDGGLYEAMNKGLEKMRGQYVLFLNAGDTLAGPDTLKKISARIAAEKTRPDFIYGDSFESAENGKRIYKPARTLNLPPQNMFTHHQAMLYRREMLENIRFDLSYKIAADYDFTCRALQRTKSILYCPFAVCIFKSGGLSQQRALQGRREQFHIRRKLGTSNTLQNAVIFILQSGLWQIRRSFPALYWHFKSLRSSGNRPRGSAQT